MRFARLIMLLAAAGALAHAQIDWDSTGNSQLNGTYYFRQVYWLLGDGNGNLGQAISVYGRIKFDGNGNWSITSTEDANYVDSINGTGRLVNTGTYKIASSGYGWISSPYYSGTSTTAGDVVYGLVNDKGIFVGSSTDNPNSYNDMMVAAKVASPLPTASSFTGAWTAADFDFSSGAPGSAMSIKFGMTPDGNTNLGTVNAVGYIGAGASPVSQTYTGATYSFSNGAAVAKFPVNAKNMITGTKYFYFSADGSFMFGGDPQSFDLIVGVKNATGTPALGKLYYQAGVDEIQGYLDSYFGATSVVSGATLLGHQRINGYGGYDLYDYAYEDQVSIGAGGTYTGPLANYIVGSGGVVITSGIGQYLGLSVMVPMSSLSGPGVFLDPTGITNSATYTPFTAGIAPGELLTMLGTGLAATTRVAGIPFPTSLANVQVSIGGLPAPIYYVSPTQLSAIVPYGISGSSACGCVQIIVTNNGVVSNAVTAYVNASAPGVFRHLPIEASQFQNPNGLGYGEIGHLDGTPVSKTNPAHMGETLAVYLTGLGAVSPTINDGAPGSSDANNLNKVTNTFQVLFNGSSVTATPIFAGLAPGFSGLYQLNFTVPSTGLTVGDNYMDLSGPGFYASYLLLPVAAATSSSDTALTPNARPSTETVSAPHRPQRVGGATANRRTVRR